VDDIRYIAPFPQDWPPFQLAPLHVRSLWGYVADLRRVDTQCITKIHGFHWLLGRLLKVDVRVSDMENKAEGDTISKF
jgi:hypothetical protein